MIEVKNLSKDYIKQKIVIPALHDVTCSVREGEYFAIVGRSGSGKSTLLNLIGGLDRPSAGQIVFQGKDLMTMSRAELANHRRFSVGMIFQSFNLIHSRTALENVALALAFGGMARRKRKGRAVELLASVGLEGRIHHKPDELSGGEAQRVAIARAMANQPRVLLADEPTGNLDSTTSAEIVGLLKKLNTEKGITVLMVTHDLETAGRVSDRIIQLKDGRAAE
jgi:putative ABC transport system ATP-binding protein